MAKITCAEDVYRQLVEEPEEGWLYGLVAFAVVEEQRIEWMNHVKEHEGEVPNAEEIRLWYERQPEGVLLRAKGTAENALQNYSDEVLQEVLEAERRDVSDGIIVSEVRMARKILPQFGINVAGGFVSAFLFAAVLTILAVIVLKDISPVQLGNGLFGNQTQEKTNGEKNNQSGSN